MANKPKPEDYNAPPINREQYRPVANPDRLSSFKLALSGLWYMLRNEHSIRLLSGYSVLVIGAGIWLRVESLAMVGLILGIGATWVTECLNTAIEAAVDLAMPELHPLAKVAKDVGGAATMLSAFLSLVVTLLVLGPPLLERLGVL